MVKLGVSKKQAKPTTYSSTIKNTGPSIASSNYKAILNDHNHYNEAIKLMIRYLPKHPHFGPFDVIIDVIRMPFFFKCVFSTYIPEEDLDQICFKLANDSMVVLTKSKFLDAINLRVMSSNVLNKPSNDDVFKVLYKMRYRKRLKGVADFKKGKLPTVWQFVCHYLICCLSGRTGGTGAMGKQLLDLLWSIFTGEAVNSETILWDDFIQYIRRKTPREGLTKVTSARFWSQCIRNLHNEAHVSISNDINHVACRDLKRYTLIKDQPILDILGSS